MSDAKHVLNKIVAPSIGCVVGVLMFASPLMAVLKMRKTGHIGEINPYPYPMIVANCVGWIVYSFVTEDLFIFVPNQIGLLIGTYFTVTVAGYTDMKTRDRLNYLLIFFMAVLSSLGVVTIKGGLEPHDVKTMWGLTTNAILLIYYAAPLSTMWEVLQTKNSSSLYWPLAVMAIVNGSMWFIYGLANSDPYVWVPNGVGAVLGGLQMLLIGIFPARVHRLRASGGSDASLVIRDDSNL